MYKQVQSFSSTGAKVAQQKAAISAKAYVEEMIRTKRAEMMQGQFAVDTVGAMINKNFAVESPTSSFNVSHQDVFTIRREVGFTGSLNELSKNPSLLHWKAMDAPIKLPVGARAILISATIPQSQNTGPVSYVVKTKNMETNSKWTAGTTVDGDVYLKPHMTSPLQCNWSIYSRPNVETFDVKSLEGWDKITEVSSFMQGLVLCCFNSFHFVSILA